MRNRKILVALVTLGIWTFAFYRTHRALEVNRQAPPVTVQGAPLDSPAQVSGIPQRALPKGADPAELAQPAPVPEKKPGYLALTFDQLSDYDYPVGIDGVVGRLWDGSKPEIPENIKKLDNQKVTLAGFMVPLDFTDEKVSEFILVKNQLLCCYGQQPQINEWSIVELSEPVSVVYDLPVTVSGNFHVQEVMDEDMLLYIYRLSGARLD